MNYHSNELQAIVRDLKNLDITLSFLPAGDDLFHFKIVLNNKGVKTEFVNEYNIDRLQEIMKTAYIHFHKKLHWDTRNYKQALEVELPPETYFLNVDEFGVYPPSGRLYLGFTKPWFFSVNQERKMTSYLSDIKNAEVLGHLSGWFELHSKKDQEKYRKELEGMLNSQS